MSQIFTLYHSDSIGRASNCSYPHAVEVTDADTLAAAVMYDYVAVEYKNGYRNNINFIKTTCLVLDCDNDHSEDPTEWITPEQLHEALPDVAFAVHYSRNHNKVKNGKTARPKFHCFFPIPELTDSAAYSALKRQVQAIFTFFDPNALDAARFFFGTTKPEVAFFDGDLTITDYLADYAFESMEMADSTVIPEGSRNSTLSHFAGRVLKRYGNTDEAYDAFQQEAAKCDPPLEEHELKTIWRSALQFYRKVQQQDGYVAPEHYNTEFQYAEETHPAIIDAATFTAAKARLDEIAAATAQRSRPTRCAFSGIIVCGQCGEKYKRIKNHNHHAWNCRAYAMQGKAGCSGLQIREDVLQQAAADALGLDAYDEDTFRERIASVVSGADHVLTFRFRDGHTAEIKWEKPSRARSWTPEMRQAAAERTRQQRRKP